MSSPVTSLPSLSERLQLVTEALAAAHTQEDVFGIVLTPALQALDAVAGAVLLVDETGARLEMAARQGYDAQAQTLWQDGPLDGNVPAGDALERHEALFFEQEGDLVRAYPELEARTGGVAAVATAVLPMFLDEQPLGVIILDFKEPHEFTDEETRFLRTLASQCALALGRTRLLTDLQRQVEERTRRIEEVARAQEAFVAFTEAVGTETDVLALARQAVTVLKLRFPACSSGYYELNEGLWKLRVHTEDLNDQLQLRQTLLDGLPRDTPSFAQALETGTPVFLDAWDAAQGQIERTEAYGTVANFPLVLAGEVRAILSLGLKRQQQWAERDRAVFRAVGRGLNLALERTEQARQLRAQKDAEERRTQALQAFAELSRDLVLETDPLVLVRRTQEIVLALLPPGFSGYFEPQEGLWRIGSQVGHTNTPELQAALDTGLPFEAASNLLTPWQRGEPFYQAAYNPALDQLTGSEEYPGASVTLPIRVGGQTRGVLGFALYTQRSWSGEDRAVLETVGRQLTLALERAEGVRQREEERAALDAFVAYSEAVGTETDETRLAGRAVDVLRARFADCSGGYYQREGELWKLRTWTSDLDARPEFLAALRAGLPSDTPFIAELLSTRAPTFTENWDAQHERVQDTEMYGTVASYPVVVEGNIHGFFVVGLKNTTRWAERDRAIFRSVGRGLDLAFERAEGTRRLEAQNAELDARTRALEGFASLTRDLSVHHEPEVFKERTLAMALSLLSPGYAAFWRLEGDRWQVTTQVGEVGSPELQAAIDAGLPAGQTPTLDLPVQTREALFQDLYDQSSDVAPELVRHLHTVATLPVLVNGEVAGIFNVVLFGPRPWSPADRAVLETTARSLGLALEGAQSVAQLAQRTRELERSNAELEQFAYVASHDLQAPIRAVTSFAGVIDKRYGGQLDDRGRLYLRQIVESGEHMKQLVDDLLAFSRVHTERRALRQVDSGAVFDAVAGRLLAQTPDARLTRGDLPTVLADTQQLDQLLQNLMSNGLKYHREGVTPQMHVWAEREGRVWRFAVRDNGIGIEPQYFERIFVIFQRLHGREEYEGTGIGLAVCKKIVERHGGRLWVESTPGQGSSFFFTLPEG